MTVRLGGLENKKRLYVGGQPISRAYIGENEIWRQTDFSAEYHGHIFYGQSLAAGYQRPDVTLPAVLTDGSAAAYDAGAPFDSLTFAGGPRQQSPTALVPHIESALYEYAGGGNLSYYGESPSAGAAFEFINQGVARADLNYQANNWRIVSLNAARGAASILHLFPPTDPSHWTFSVGDVPYTVFEAQVQAAQTLATASNRTFDVAAISWMQGEGNASSMNRATYGGHLSTLFSAMSTSVRTITGQQNDPVFFTYQTYAYTRAAVSGVKGDSVAAAQLAADDNTSTFFVTPLYPFALKKGYGGTTMHQDGHLSAVGSRLIGAYFGRAQERVLYEKTAPPRVQPTSATASARTITISFSVPSGPLVFDTAQTGTTPQYEVKDMGFAVEDATGMLALSNVQIGAGGTTVTFDVDRDLAANPVVRYAHDYLPPIPGNDPALYVDGDPSALIDYNGSAAGNLRDSDTDVVSINGTSYNMHNWCPHFSLPIS